MSSLSLLELLLLLRADADLFACIRRCSPFCAGKYAKGPFPLTDFLPLDMDDKDDTEKEWTNRPGCTWSGERHEEEHAVGTDQLQNEHATTKRSRQQRYQGAAHGAQRVSMDSARRMGGTTRTQAAGQAVRLGGIPRRNVIAVSENLHRAVIFRALTSESIQFKFSHAWPARSQIFVFFKRFPPHFWRCRFSLPPASVFVWQ